MKPASLGEQELGVLRFVTDHAPISVAHVVERYGTPLGLARTTVLTVMERLRQKGYLMREKCDGVYQYRPQLAKQELLHGLIGEFVAKSLGGSLAPFAAYMAETIDLSDDEAATLRRMLARMETQQKGSPS